MQKKPEWIREPVYWPSRTWLLTLCNRVSDNIEGNKFYGGRKKKKFSRPWIILFIRFLGAWKEIEMKGNEARLGETPNLRIRFGTNKTFSIGLEINFKSYSSKETRDMARDTLG